MFLPPVAAVITPLFTLSGSGGFTIVLWKSRSETMHLKGIPLNYLGYYIISPERLHLKTFSVSIVNRFSIFDNEIRPKRHKKKKMNNNYSPQVIHGAKAVFLNYVWLIDKSISRGVI